MTDFLKGIHLDPPSMPLIIAELSGNHNGSLDRMLALVDAAAQAGAHAIKLQTYTADTMTFNSERNEFCISDPKSLWNGRKLYDLYSEAATPWEWHPPIYKRCRSHGVVCFSTPFDRTSIQFLESLDTPLYKVASFENTDHDLLRQVAATGKPVIMSTGMATVAELSESVQILRDAGCVELALLKCTSTYPSLPENSNLLTIPHLKDLFNCSVGLSDHTLGIGVAVASVVVGATIIEKHLTLNRSDGGVDAAFSLEPKEFKQLVDEVKNAALSLGKIAYGPTAQELKSLQFRRSLYFGAPLKKGDNIQEFHVRAVRPNAGLPPKYRELILGRTVTKDIEIGTPITWDVLL